MEITQKGIRWGAAELWKYHRGESAGERRSCGNTTEGNPLGSGGVVGIPQNGLERMGALMGLTPRSERGRGSKGGGEEKIPRC